MRLLLRLVIGALVAALVVVAAIPLLVLRDLTNGGTGWGLCDQGLSSCTNSYFSGFELVAGLMLALLLVLTGLRVATRTLRHVEHRYDRARAAAAVVPSDDPSAPADGRTVTYSEPPR